MKYSAENKNPFSIFRTWLVQSQHTQYRPYFTNNAIHGDRHNNINYCHVQMSHDSCTHVHIYIYIIYMWRHKRGCVIAGADTIWKCFQFVKRVRCCRFSDIRVPRLSQRVEKSKRWKDRRVCWREIGVFEWDILYSHENFQNFSVWARPRLCFLTMAAVAHVQMRSFDLKTVAKKIRKRKKAVFDSVRFHIESVAYS